MPAIISPFDGILSFYETGKMRYIKVVSEFQKKIYMIKDGYTGEVKK
jgi:hypothetical protein